MKRSLGVYIFLISSVFSFRIFPASSKTVDHGGNPVKFLASQYDPEKNEMWLASAENDKGNKALVKAWLDTSDNTVKVKIPTWDSINLNGVANKPSDIAGSSIKNIALAGSIPVVVINKDKNDSVQTSICVFDDSDGTEKVYQNQSPQDAAKKIVSDVPVGLAVKGATKKDLQIFTIVPDDDWGGVGSPLAFKKDHSSGLAVFKVKADGADLEQVDQDGAGTLTYKIPETVNDSSVNPDKTSIGFTSGAKPTNLAYIFVGGGNVAMHYDEKFNIFFLGLQGVMRGHLNGQKIESLNAQNSICIGGAVSLLVGRTGDDGKLVGVAGADIKLAPVVKDPTGGPNVDNAFFYERADQIVGFYSKKTIPQENNKSNFVASIFNVNVMHTTTGKSYLIANGGVIDIEANYLNESTLASRVYALPIVSFRDEKSVGRLAKITAHASGEFLSSDVATKHSEMVKVFNMGFPKNDVPNSGTAGNDFNADEVPFVVGGSYNFFGGEYSNGRITEMQVIGDTVYASVDGLNLAGTTVNAETVTPGIFASTAIFSEKGFIVRWTPWQRVGSTMASVTGFGLNESTGSMMCLAAENVAASPAVTRVLSSALGKGGSAIVKTTATATDTHRREKGLTETLNSFFGEGGVYNVFDFDSWTPGFKAGLFNNAFGAYYGRGLFSMMIALGGNKLAMIQTGKENATTKSVDPLEKFELNKEVFTFIGNHSGEALFDIAPLTSACIVVKVKVSFSGYVFVGGLNGLARFEKPLNSSMSGFDAKNDAGLEKLEADPNPGQYKFPGGNKWKFVEIPEFKDKKIINLASFNEQIFVQTTEKVYRCDLNGNPLTAVGGDELSVDASHGLDMVVVGDQHVIVASTEGLKVFKLKSGEAVEQFEIPLLTDTEIPISMAYISRFKGINDGIGNLFVLAIDAIEDKCFMYRFAVNTAKTISNIVQPIAGDEMKRIDLGPTRRRFATDGSMFLDVCSISPSNSVLVKSGVAQKLIGNLRGELPLGLLGIDPAEYIYANRPRIDTTLGSWVIPGSFGMRTLE
jgi:hypothetical protein